ncbi:hypothetical protein NP233_g7298 [Leucocoprinus birnbaumii]|uniref:Uncharacterized protein n=1 Tax=Leucocoprinus birnbaumii TaxID=56174 RepID=A0AAD5YQ45_9AGAR|nr:hypothetical protein NP233_g7298 [Leucocoprinus birnbaumii]
MSFSPWLYPPVPKHTEIFTFKPILYGSELLSRLTWGKRSFQLKIMLRILPFPLVLLTAISFAFCSINIALAFLNLELVWANFLAGALTALYHVLVIVLAWFRMSRRKRDSTDSVGTSPIIYSEKDVLGSISDSVKVGSKRSTPPPALPSLNTALDNLGSDYDIVVPYPVVIITLGSIIVAVWIIAFGITVDIAVKGFDSALASGMPISQHIDRTGLVGSSIVLVVEMVTMMAFVWFCVRGLKRTSDKERDLMEDKWFFPNTPKLERSGTWKSLRRSFSRRSVRSSKQNWQRPRSVEPPLPPAPVLLSPPTQTTIPGRDVSPWTMVTPKVPSTRTPSIVVLPPIAEVSPPLEPLRRPRDSLPLPSSFASSDLGEQVNSATILP